MICDFGLSKNTTQILKDFWSKYPQIEQVKIYGSRAKGNFKEGSDIDFAIFGELDETLILKISGEMEELPLPYKFDITGYSLIENPKLKDHIDRIGLVFWAK